MLSKGSGLRLNATEKLQEQLACYPRWEALIQKAGAAKLADEDVALHPALLDQLTKRFKSTHSSSSQETPAAEKPVPSAEPQEGVAPHPPESRPVSR